MQIRIHQIGPGMVQQIQSVCMECQGHGERISPKDRCKSCNGRKIVREKKILEVHIDKGVCVCGSRLEILNSVQLSHFYAFVELGWKRWRPK